MAPNREAEEVNTLGCCFYWTFHPGAVVRATRSPKIYYGLPVPPTAKAK